MDFLIVGFLLVGGFFLFKASSYFRAEEMLTMLKVSRELDFQYDRLVGIAVRSSKTIKEATGKLEAEAGGTILALGGRNYEMDVTAEWGDVKCSRLR